MKKETYFKLAKKDRWKDDDEYSPTQMENFSFLYTLNDPLKTTQQKKKSFKHNC